MIESCTTCGENEVTHRSGCPRGQSEAAKCGVFGDYAGPVPICPECGWKDEYHDTQCSRRGEPRKAIGGYVLHADNDPRNNSIDNLEYFADWDEYVARATELGLTVEDAPILDDEIA